MEQKIDTIRSIETPEGVELTLRTAGPVVRALAWTIDQFLRIFMYLALAIPLAFLGEFGLGLLLIFLFVIEWFYPVFFEVLNHGETPGKKAMGIAVVNDDGTSIGWTSSIIRNLLRFADFLPMSYLLGFISMLLDHDFKRLGDRIAGTLVIYRDLPLGPKTILPAKPIPVPVPLELDEQRSIIDFAERASGWTDERVVELTNLLDPLFESKEATNQEKTQILFGMAHWLKGIR